MKDLVLELLGDRPIAYHPMLAKTCGSVTAAVFLSQLLYWTGKQRDPDGWIYKTQAEMEEETGLTRSNQETARRILGNLKVLDEKLAGVPARLHYRVNLDVLLHIVETYQTSLRESSKLDSNNHANLDVEPPQRNSETTIEHPETTPPRAPEEKRRAAAYKERLRNAMIGYEQRVYGTSWETWGEGSREIKKLRDPAINQGLIKRLGHLLEHEFALAPPWGDVRRTEWWFDGLKALGALKCNENDVRAVYQQMRERDITPASPHSFINLTRGLLAARAVDNRAAPEKPRRVDPQLAAYELAAQLDAQQEQEGDRGP